MTTLSRWALCFDSRQWSYNGPMTHDGKCLMCRPQDAAHYLIDHGRRVRLMDWAYYRAEDVTEAEKKAIAAVPVLHFDI